MYTSKKFDYTTWARDSGDIKVFAGLDKEYSVKLLGDISLKGKEKPIDVYSIEGKKLRINIEDVP